jgi:hypothetical protein
MHRVSLAVAAVIAAVSLSACVPTCDTSWTSTGAVNSSSSSRYAAVPAGSSVRNGKFEFRVVNTERSKTVSDPDGNPYETVTAQGEFVVVTLSVENAGDQPRSFSGTNQKLVDASGRQYGAKSEADMWMNKGTADINPGNAIQARVAFDVAGGTQASELILHDSMFSGGAHLSI